MQVPHAIEGKDCPLHKKDVSKVCHKCPWWTQIKGKHPQSGEDLDQWACSISLLPMLLIENAKQTRSTASAVESFRNEMVDSNQKNNIVNAMMLAAAGKTRPPLISSDTPEA